MSLATGMRMRSGDRPQPAWSWQPPRSRPTAPYPVSDVCPTCKHLSSIPCIPTTPPLSQCAPPPCLSATRCPTCVGRTLAHLCPPLLALPQGGGVPTHPQPAGAQPDTRLELALIDCVPVTRVCRGGRAVLQGQRSAPAGRMHSVLAGPPCARGREVSRYLQLPHQGACAVQQAPGWVSEEAGHEAAKGTFGREHVGHVGCFGALCEPGLPSSVSSITRFHPGDSGIQGAQERVSPDGEHWGRGHVPLAAPVEAVQRFLAPCRHDRSLRSAPCVSRVTWVFSCHSSCLNRATAHRGELLGI